MIAKCKEKKGKYSQNPANEPNQKANRNNRENQCFNTKIEIKATKFIQQTQE